MSTKRLLPIFLLAALLSGIPADGKPKNFRTLQLLALKEMRETTIAAQKSDDVMLKEIDVVANHLQRFLYSRTRTRGSEPLYMRKSEVDALQRSLAHDVGPNPYADNPYLKSGTESESSTSWPGSKVTPSSLNAHALDGSTDVSANSKPTPPTLEQPSTLKNINVFENKPVRQSDAPRVILVSTQDVSWYDAESLRKEAPLDWRAEPGTIQIVHNDRDRCFIWGAGIEGRPVFDRTKQRFKVVAIRVGLH